MAITNSLHALPLAILKACGVPDGEEATEFTLHCTVNGHTLTVLRFVRNADTDEIETISETWTRTLADGDE